MLTGSGREATSVPVLTMLFLVASGASHDTVSGLITFEKPSLPSDDGPSGEGPKLAADTQV